MCHVLRVLCPHMSSHLCPLHLLNVRLTVCRVVLSVFKSCWLNVSVAQDSGQMDKSLHLSAVIS